MSSHRKIAITCSVIVCVAIVMWIAATRQRSLPAYTYSQFLNQVEGAQVSRVKIIASDSGAVEVTYRLKNGEAARTILPADYRVALASMLQQRVNVEIRNSSSESLQLLIKVMPFFFLLGVWIFLMIVKFPNGPGSRLFR